MSSDESMTELLHLRPATTCAVHDWPTPGLGKRLLDEARQRHPMGIDVCEACILRARRDAIPQGPRLFRVQFATVVYQGRPTTDLTSIEVQTRSRATQAWATDPGVQETINAFWPTFKLQGYRIALDPLPTERPLPPGIECPRSIAAKLQAYLRSHYPEEDIHVWSATDPEPTLPPSATL